jgi:hypothetical protein
MADLQIDVTEVTEASTDSKKDGEITSKAELRERKKLDAMFEETSKKKLESLGVMDMPTPLDNIQLYEHQKQGITWLVQTERSHESPKWWKVEKSRSTGEKRWVCEITGKRKKNKPKPVKGSILADEMGLGEKRFLSFF